MGTASRNREERKDQYSLYFKSRKSAYHGEMVQREGRRWEEENKNTQSKLSCFSSNVQGRHRKLKALMQKT